MLLLNLSKIIWSFRFLSYLCLLSIVVLYTNSVCILAVFNFFPVFFSFKRWNSHITLSTEMEKQLIKQVVEKTKQGSPVVLNTQKMLSLVEATEHNL